MKHLLLKICMVVATVITTSACDSSEPMKPDEIEKWIAAYSPERIDIGAVIRVESTDSLLARIDTLRSLDKVFRFSPSIEGTPRYVNCGRYIDFVPKSGSLKQGVRYNCRVALSQLTGIDSLKDFSFDIVVEKRESRLAELCVSIDPDNVQQVIITGKMLFSIAPSDQSTDASLVECNVAGTKVSIKNTDDKLCHTFTIHGIRRKTKDFPLHIKYNPRGEFSTATSSVVVPGLSEFKMLYAERRESTQPYVDIEFSAPLAANQELDGLITIDEIENIYQYNKSGIAHLGTSLTVHLSYFFIGLSESTNSR